MSIRANFGLYYDPDLGNFSPISADQELWLSSNPLGAILSIDIEPFGPLDNDGSVVCSSYEQGCCWVFSTLYDDNNVITSDLYHPVSGNRQFGLLSNHDNTYTFYIKGADRVTNWWDWMLMGGTIYAGGSNLWINIINNIYQFVGSSNSQIIAPSIFRTDWLELKNKLKGIQPINSLPCSN